MKSTLTHDLLLLLLIAALGVNIYFLATTSSNSAENDIPTSKETEHRLIGFGVTKLDRGGGQAYSEAGHLLYRLWSSGLVEINIVNDFELDDPNKGIFLESMGHQAAGFQFEGWMPIPDTVPGGASTRMSDAGRTSPPW